MWLCRPDAFKNGTYTPDAIVVSPVGEVWNGQAEISAHVDKLANSVFKYFTSKYTVKDIHFLAPTVALMSMHVADVLEQEFNMPDGSKSQPKGSKSENMFLHTFVKQNGIWKISSTQVTPIMTMDAQTEVTVKGD